MFENDCFIDLDGRKMYLSFLLVLISEKMFSSDVFPDKNRKPFHMSRTLEEMWVKMADVAKKSDRKSIGMYNLSETSHE